MLLLALYFLALIVLAGFFAARAARLKMQQRPSFRIYAALFGLVFGYLFAEFAVTVYYGFGWAGTSLWLFDESGKTVHFDPIRGYILGPQPSRWSRITNGSVEFVATLKGNSQGFPTRTDFGPERPDSSTRRIAVFGDSFTAADFLDMNWPDRAQSLAQGGGEKLQLLNFSGSGVGLANWWSVLTRYVAPQNYQLDGIIFVVFDEDLERKFFVGDHRADPHAIYRRCRSWDPQTYPATLDQARSCPPAVNDAYIVSDHEFQQALERKWPESVPRSSVRWALLKQIHDYLDRWWNSRQGSQPKSPGFEPGQERLITDIRQFIAGHKLPALVIYLPNRERLMKSTWETDPYRAQTQAFARMIGARFADASGAFAGMPPVDVRKCFFPHDNHWNQAGSDRFAQYALRLIRQSW